MSLSPGNFSLQYFPLVPNGLNLLGICRGHSTEYWELNLMRHNAFHNCMHNAKVYLFWIKMIRNDSFAFYLFYLFYLFFISWFFVDYIVWSVVNKLGKTRSRGCMSSERRRKTRRHTLKTTWSKKKKRITQS